jgi:hypothetical protein
MSAIDWGGRKRQPCPDCGRGPKDMTCGVTVEHDGKGVAHCFRCGYIQTRHGDTASSGSGSRQTRAAAPIRHETLSNYGRELWAACMPLAGEALAYLAARKCAIPPPDGDLRWHPALPHPPSGIAGPALVGLVTDILTAKPISLHRAWTRAAGTKAPVDPPRMLLGGHRKAGGVIRLWPDDSVTTGLGIAEGIETALSLAHAYTPVWACIDAGNLAAFPVLEGIQSLMIAADHDPVGIAAAEACAARWGAVGRAVRIAMAPTPGADLNDLLREAA